MTLPDASRRSRRAVLAGAIGGIAALVAQSVHRPAAVDAATGDIVKVGGSYTGTRTIFDNPTGTGVIGVTRGGVGRSGLKGESRTPFGYGVIGTSSSSADESGGVLGEGLGRGVIGHALGYGVEGISDAEGVGVYGRATNENGVGGRFEASTHAGMGLIVDGRVSFSSSGTAQIASGQRSAVVTPGIPLAASTRVLATLQSDPGGDTIVVARVVVNAVADSFTVRLSSDAVTSCSVAWFVIG